MLPAPLPFAKMNGAGNSILVVDERGRPPAITGEEARRIAEGRLGFDQMMVLSDADRPGVDALVRIFNTDGSRAGACGNGTRCVAWYMLQNDDRATLALDIEGTEVVCRRDGATTFTLDMGVPRFGWRDIPLREPVDTQAVRLGPVLREFHLDPPAAVSMGNPHAVFFVPDAAAIDLARLGSQLEQDAMFPDRANISFAEVRDRTNILLRVWERGAGATLACGSAACATLVAAVRRGLTDRRATLALPGGDLGIAWRDDDHVFMTGPVEVEELGALSLEAFGVTRDGVEVLTFGCRLNIVESDAMRAEARAAGHDDLVIVNTCAVTAEAARQARQAIRRARRARPESKIVVTGCAAEIDGPAFAAMPEVDAILRNDRKTAPESWLRPGFARSPQTDAGPTVHTRGFVEIQNGCDHRCTFCVIPFGRGPSRSVPPDLVVATVRGLVEAGSREAVLTGVDITSYESDGVNLGGLVKRLLGEVPGLERLRLSSIDCIEVDPDLVEAIAFEPRLMPHLHLSLQSGADLILKRMKRRHSRAEALELCRRLRALRPAIVFGADLIVGFPTETEAHFAETLHLVEGCGITHVHAFPYSQRPGTPAARMPAVPGEVVKHRAARLRAAGDAALGRHLDAQVGRRLRVLSERGGRGRAEDFTAVRLGDVPPNQMCDVLIEGHDGRELRSR